MSQTSTKKTVTQNLLWRFGERVLAQLVAFVVSVILARLLEPSAYGTIALIMVFTTIFQVFVDSGLGNALIQKKDADEIDYSTVFYANIVFCLCLYVILFFFAPVIARYYNDDLITGYVRVLGITIIISGAKNVQQAYISKHMMFRLFFYATLGGTITAGVVGVLMAYNGFGIWALISQHIINHCIDTIILWVCVRWTPKRVFSVARFKQLFAYGWKLLVSRLLDTVYNNLRQLIIGKKYTKDSLAYYNEGEKMPNLIVSNINASIDSVLFPAMSEVQEDQDRIRMMTRRAISTSVCIMAPLMLGLASVAEPLIRLLLTEKWLPAVPYVRIFCVLYMFYPIHTANLNAIKAMGRSDIFLKLELIKKVIGIVVLVISMRISVLAMAYSLLITDVIGQVINSMPNRKLLDYGYFKQIWDILPSLLLAVVMGVCVYLLPVIDSSDLLTLAYKITAGAIIYIGSSVLLRVESFSYTLSVIKSFSSKRKQHG